MAKYLPSVPEVTKEAATVVAGAVLAALIMSQLPALKRWIKSQWA